MSSSCFHCSRKIAYFVLSQNQRANEAHLKAIQEYCLTLPYEVDTFAEEVVDPSNNQSPLFKQVMELIRQGEVSELIIPSLGQVLGHDLNSRKEFLEFLRENHVKLVTLTKEPSQLASFLGGDI